MHGIGLVLEAVRQIRGTSASQVPGADVSLLLGGPVAPLVSATVFGSAGDGVTSRPITAGWCAPVRAMASRSRHQHGTLEW